MDIIVRNIDEIAIQKIDKLAGAEGVSRNEYLKEQIESMAVLGEIKKERECFELALSEVANVLEVTFKQLDMIEKGYERLFVLITLATGIDLDEVDRFVKKELNLNS